MTGPAPVSIKADDLNRFIQCNGSRLMEPTLPPDNTPDDPTSVRAEGIAAHYMALAVYRGEHDSPDELIDRQAPNGVYMTVDMAEHVAGYLEVIRSQEYVDDGMELDTSFAGVRARVDHVGLTTDGVVRINDLKYGWGIVDPENNWTLVAHMIGAYRALKLKTKPTGFALSIYQPRPYHRAGPYRTWALTYEQYQDLYEQLRKALDDPSDTLQTGPSCYKCPAIGSCPAYARATMNAVDASDVAFNDAMPDGALAVSLDVLQRAQTVIKQRLEACEELTKHRLRNGSTVGDYALEASYGNKRWNDGLTPEVVQAMTGVDCAKPGLITPAQAKKKGVNEAVIDSLTNRPSTGVKLIRESANKRAVRLLGKPKEVEG